MEGGSDSLVSNLKSILRSGERSDVIFKINETVFKAHIFILELRSPVFRTMFSGTWNNCNETILIDDVSEESFTEFLQFLYSDEIEFSCPMELLYLGEKYNIPDLIQRSKKSIISNLHIKNAISVLEAGKLYDSDELKSHAFNYLLKNAKELIESKEYLKLDEGTWIELLKNDELLLDEILIFGAIKKWGESKLLSNKNEADVYKLRNVLNGILPFVRFPLMDIENFTSFIVSTGILSPEETLPIYMFLSTKDPTKKKLISTKFNTSPRGDSSKTDFEPSNYSIGLYLTETLLHGTSRGVFEEYLDFVVDSDILMMGVGLYGGGGERSGFWEKYEIRVELHTYLVRNDGHMPARKKYGVTKKLSAQADFETHFLSPVFIHKCQIYHLRVTIYGNVHKFGSLRVFRHSAITTSGKKINFNIMPAYGRGTGKIRSIIFKVPPIAQSSTLVDNVNQ